MSVALAHKSDWISPGDYLEIERSAAHKSEYFDGEMFLMAGASKEHSRIAMAMARILGVQLLGNNGEPFGSATRVRIPSANYCYPDLTVACNPAWMDQEADTLLNPLVIVEILSPSTEARDRGGKFREYRKIASLREYVLISQDQPLIEIYTRREGGGWLLRAVEGPDASMPLESVPDVELPCRKFMSAFCS